MPLLTELIEAMRKSLDQPNDLLKHVYDLEQKVVASDFASGTCTCRIMQLSVLCLALPAAYLAAPELQSNGVRRSPACGMRTSGTDGG